MIRETGEKYNVILREWFLPHFGESPALAFPVGSAINQDASSSRDKLVGYF